MTEFIKKTDAQLQQDVLRELKWDPRVAETEVGVSVKQGIVTLSGFVDSYGKQKAAEKAAHRVGGVLDVANDLKVKIPSGFEKNDPEIAEAVRQALKWDVFVPHERLHTTISDGYVTITGTVDFQYQRNATERAIRNLAGVKGVINQIEVVPSKVSPERIQQSIEDALKRQTEREVRQIHVSVENGTVTVSGAVRSWAERQAVLGAARGTLGVRKVTDQLSVKI